MKKLYINGTSRNIAISIITTTLLATTLHANGVFDVKLIDKGECDPVAENDRPGGGMQKNRRVDVSIEEKVIELKTIQKPVHIKTKAYLENGGVIWATSDPLAVEPHLDIMTNAVIAINNQKALQPVTFYTYTNYSDFIDHYALLVYKIDQNGNKQPIKLLEGKKIPHELLWEIDKEKSLQLHKGDTLKYILRVYDKEGHYDETAPKSILLSENAEFSKEDYEAQIYGKTTLKIRSIPVNGARVRVYGEGIEKDNILNIDGTEVRVDSQGKFVYENIKKAGIYKIPVQIMDKNGDVYSKDLGLKVKENHIFMVALADLTVGQNSISGNIKPLSSDDHYNEDIFVDGRVAFYLKGKIKGKYLITAQMDTKESDIKDIFKDLHKKDPKSIFRHLDPDRYYYVYGDDSTSYKDTDSQGKFYLSIAWDKSRAVWGNFNTAISGNEFATVNRSLYGAKLKYSSMKLTKYGDTKTDATLFASEAQSRYAHNAFTATGGSLYYLKHREIVTGSEKIWVEVRARNSERVVEKILLKRDRDYEIDELQGRIILKRPLSPYTKGSGPSIIKDQPLDGNRILLMVDYEYIPQTLQKEQTTFGGRIKQWLGDILGIGVTYSHENRTDQDYEVKGADVTLKGGKNSYIKAEVAQSKAVQAHGANFISDDGGLSFTQSLQQPQNSTDGNAYGVEARLDLADFETIEHNATMDAWYKKREQGFSQSTLGDTEETTDYGLNIQSDVTEHTTLKAAVTALIKDSHEVRTASLETDYRYKAATIGAEIRHIKEESTLRQSGKGTLAGLRAKYDITSYFSLYAAAQSTLQHSGTYLKNDLVTVGTDLRYKKFSINLEGSSGDRGNSAQIGVDYAYNPYHTFYTSYVLSTDRTQNMANTNIFTIGQKNKITSALDIYTEHQFSHSSTMAGVAQTFGLDYAFTRYLIANLVYNRTDLDSGTQRDSVSVGLNYAAKKIKADTKLEYRIDKNGQSETKQYLTANKVEYKVNPSWRVMGKFNYAKSLDNSAGTKDAKFIEAGIGFAYRPVANARFNLIGKYTYLYDILNSAQIPQKADEKSHIFTTEFSYQLNPRWTVGSKLGLKKYQTRLVRNSGEWYTSQIILTALRLNYHIIREWDAMLEGHYLDQKDDGYRKGILIGLYKHIGDNMKLGIGYNFSDFTDDLTLLDDYTAQGWFINVIGKY
jgi:hypothetical protein